MRVGRVRASRHANAGHEIKVRLRNLCAVREVLNRPAFDLELQRVA
jgi:hypothetical protein